MESRVAKARPPISPRPTSNGFSVKDGFTFLEVLIALVIAVVLVGAVCTTLVAALKAEQSAAHLREGALLIPSIQTSNRLGLLDEDEYLAAGFAAWEWSKREEVTGAGESRQTWVRVTASPSDRPSLVVSFSLIAD